MYLFYILNLQEIKQLQELKHQYMLLQSSCDSIKNRHKQLENWSKAFTEGYDPGIWKQSEYFRPFYGQRPKDATIQGIIDELNEHHRKMNDKGDGL
jgi:hypothetical protein